MRPAGRTDQARSLNYRRTATLLLEGSLRAMFELPAGRTAARCWDQYTSTSTAACSADFTTFTNLRSLVFDSL